MADATPIELPPPPTPLLHDHNEARWPVMDPEGHARLSPEDTRDFTPPQETRNDDTVERGSSGPPNSPLKRLAQEIYPAEDSTPRRRSARLAQTSTPVRPSMLRITVPQVEEAVEESDAGNDTAEMNQDVEDGERRTFAFFRGGQCLYQSPRRY